MQTRDDAAPTARTSTSKGHDNRSCPRPPLAHGPRWAQRHRVDERRERDGRPRAFTRRRGPRARLPPAPRRQRGRRDVLRDGHSTARGPRVTRRHGLRRVLRRVRRGEDALARAAQRFAAERLLKSSTVDVSFLEIAGESCCDLLKDRETVKLLADASGTIQPVGLSKNQCASLDDFDAKTKNANKLRATAATERNSVSSRSHAVCQLKAGRRPAAAR